MFEKIIGFIFSKRLKNQLKKQQRQQRFVNYANAHSIFLLFESDYAEKNVEVRRIIQKLTADGKKVTAWGYTDKKLTSTPILPDFRIINKKEIDFSQRPHESVLNELAENKFDLMIDLTEKEIFPLQYIALYVTADFKTGIKRNHSKIYDFMMDMNGIANQSEENLVDINATFIYNQIIFYLKSIQTSD
jgi:hypothetical protein